MKRPMTSRSVLAHVARDWWLLVLRGLAALYFAGVAFVAPEAVVEALLLTIGFIALLDGFFGLALALHWRRSISYSWLFWIEGACGVVIGFLLLDGPVLDVWQALHLIVLWATITGALELIVGLNLRADTEVEMLMLTSGTLTLVFGLMLFVWMDSLKATLLWITSYAFVYGVFMLALGAELRRYARNSPRSLESV